MTSDNHDRVDDELLFGLDQMTNILYWYQTRASLRAGAALTEAIDDWIGEHAAEHHHSQPFLDGVDADGDPLGAVLAHLAAAITTLRAARARPGLTFTNAFSEAIAGWVASVTAEHHRSQPFQPVDAAIPAAFVAASETAARSPNG